MLSIATTNDVKETYPALYQDICGIITKNKDSKEMVYNELRDFLSGKLNAKYAARCTEIWVQNGNEMLFIIKGF